MKKLLYLLNQRQHFKNRIRQRGGNVLCFLFSKVIDKKQVQDDRKDECLVWRYKNHIYLTQNNQLQTYMKSPKDY